MMKEFVKGNNSVIASFREYMQKKLRRAILFNKDLSFSTKSPLFKSEGMSRYVTIFAGIVHNSFAIKSYPEKDFNGIMFGVDVSEFNVNDNLLAFFGYEDEGTVLNRFGSTIFSALGGSRKLFETYVQLNSSNDNIEKGMIIRELLEKNDVDLGYILRVYPDVVDFFYDACVPNELLHKVSEITLIDAKPTYYNTGSKFFTGPYGKDFCNELYNHAVSRIRKDFDGFYLRNDSFTFIQDRQFLPWAIILTEDPEVKGIKRVFDRGVFFINIDKARYYASVKRLNGKGAAKNIGFFDGSGESYAYSILPCSVSALEVRSKSSDSSFYWANW